MLLLNKRLQNHFIKPSASGDACSVGRLKREMAEICVKAVLAVADLERKDVNLDLIKVRVGIWFLARVIQLLLNVEDCQAASILGPQTTFNVQLSDVSSWQSACGGCLSTQAAGMVLWYMQLMHI